MDISLELNGPPCLNKDLLLLLQDATISSSIVYSDVHSLRSGVLSILIQLTDINYFMDAVSGSTVLYNNQNKLKQQYTATLYFVLFDSFNFAGD